MKRRLLLLSAAASAATALSAHAADVPWPNRPLRLLVPGGTAGVIDIRARWLAPRLAPLLGQNIIVENHPGAGGKVGMEKAAHSAPDGYTLIVIHQGVMTIAPHLYRDPGYDALADFIPIARMGVSPLLLAVHPDVKARTVSELVELARAHPGRLHFGSPGIGTPPHMAGVLFNRLVKIDTTHVPYKGGGQSMADLIAGQLTFAFEGLTVSLPQVRGSRVRPLAVTGSTRVGSLPDVPTMAESGVADYEYLGWVGIAVPARTPEAIVARLHRDIAGILATDEAKTWLGEFGTELVTETPQQFAAAIRAEHEKWGVLIRDEGIKVE